MFNQSTAFCISCGCKMPYSISNSVEKITKRGVTFDYVELHARCSHCGELIYVPEINDENVNSKENGYRKAAKLITVSEVKGR